MMVAGQTVVMGQSMVAWRSTTAGLSAAAGRRATMGPSTEMGSSGTVGQSAVVGMVAGQVGREHVRCGGGVQVGLWCNGGGTMDDNAAAVVAQCLVASRQRPCVAFQALV